ncbi:hypothetical+protein [Methylocapsa aurea]|uniref:winged helix-turn-helix domain-containing protein n=1 Tax=Methylocapsa aurea TaxID=663610 RepID=UPI003D18B853
MTPIEAKIVARLRRSRGRYVSRAALAESVYGDSGKVAALSSAVARLRRKGVDVEAKRGSGYRIGRLKSEGSYFKLPAPIVVETPRLPPTLAQMLGPILAAGVRDLARRYALGDLARRAVALVAGPRPHVGAIEFSRRGDGVYELRRPLLHHKPAPPNL